MIACEQVIHRSKSADRIGDFTKAPGRGADPAEVLGRIAEMGDFPIQRCAYAVWTDHQIAISKVAMHQDDGPLFRDAVFEQAQGQFEGWARIVEAAVDLLILIDLRTSIHHRQRGQLRLVHGVNAGKQRSALASKFRSGASEFVIAQNFTRDRFARDAPHDIGSSQSVLRRAYMNHLGRSSPGGAGGADHQRLVGKPQRMARALHLHPARRAAQDVARAGDIKRPGLLARSAGQTPQALHRAGRVELSGKLLQGGCKGRCVSHRLHMALEGEARHHGSAMHASEPLPLGQDKPPSPPSLWARLSGWFFTGLAIAAPIGITLWIVWAFVNFLDGVVIGILPNGRAIRESMPFGLPGAGISIGIVILTLIGAIAANIIGRNFLGVAEQLLDRIPFVRSIYGALKQIFDAFFNKKSETSFRGVVLVEYPRAGAWSVGFLTGDARGEIGRAAGADFVGVFVPTSPNPATGFVVFAHRDQVRILDMTVEEGARVIFSAGLLIPEGGGKSRAPSQNEENVGPPTL